MKIAIIGAGKVGSTLAYTLLERGINELTLTDIRADFLDGVRMDLQSAFPFAKILTKGSIEDFDVIVMTAGFPRTPDIKTREELFEKNRRVVDDIFSEKKFKKTAKIIMVTNPVVEITKYVQKITGLPEENVIEFGNQLDSNRLKYLAQDKDAEVTGGHGENMKVAEGYEDYQDMVKNYAPEIIKKTGGTVFGPAKALADVVMSLD